MKLAVCLSLLLVGCAGTLPVAPSVTSAIPPPSVATSPSPPLMASSTPTLTIFSVPGSLSTSVIALNGTGIIVGSYSDAPGVTRSYIRDTLGIITTFSVPGSSVTNSHFINDEGDVAGTYVVGTVEHYVNKGFVRNWSGTLVLFDLPDENTVVNGMQVTGFNNDGTVVGAYQDSSFILHGFQRDQFGTVTTYLPDGAINTLVDGINGTGELAGTYIDANKVSYGFVVSK